MGAVVQHLADEQHVIAMALGAQAAAFEHRQRTGEHRRAMAAEAPAAGFESLDARAGRCEAARQLDMRFGYRLRRGATRTLDLFADVFNVTNRANFENPTGDRRLTDFLNLTTLRAGAVPTTLQLGARFEF